MSAQEEWRPVPGYADYAVSDHGRVVSHKRATPKLLRAFLSYNGYQQVELLRDRVGKKFKVHQLVALTFIGERPEGMETRHLDGDKSNNAASNLIYGTRSENIRDQVKHGTHGNSKKSRCANGHAFDEANTYHWRGHRKCRTCMKAASQRASYERKMFAAANIRTAA